MLEVNASVGFDSAGQLHLSYVVSGDMAAIRWPRPQALTPQQASSPADNLWQHSCCEAFVAGAGDAAYREFNFSPSGQWAIYQFRDYRARDLDFCPDAIPQIKCRLGRQQFALKAILPKTLLPDHDALQLSLTLVIEADDGCKSGCKSGRKSYWALGHLADQPDFHLRSSFLLTLPRP